jgi:hypothetical protein
MGYKTSTKTMAILLNMKIIGSLNQKKKKKYYTLNKVLTCLKLIN